MEPIRVLLISCPREMQRGPNAVVQILVPARLILTATERRAFFVAPVDVGAETPCRAPMVVSVNSECVE
jgi:hypothetical protein